MYLSSRKLVPGFGYTSFPHMSYTTASKCPKLSLSSCPRWIHSSIARLSCGKSPLLCPFENLVFGGLQILPMMVREAKLCGAPQGRCFRGSMKQGLPWLQSSSALLSPPACPIGQAGQALLLHLAQHSHTQGFRKDWLTHTHKFKKV